MRLQKGPASLSATTTSGLGGGAEFFDLISFRIETEKTVK
jgi:hypothetical protein